MLAEVAARAAAMLENLEAARPCLNALERGFETLLREPARTPEVEEELSSAWEPEGLTEADVAALSEDDEAVESLDGTQVRALLLEVIRRAAHDWVLYRTSSRLEHRELAHDAYVWLFEEEAGHPWRRLREENGTELMSLESICEVIDIDIEVVRESVTRLTAKKIKTAGRPPERRKRQTEDGSYYDEHNVLACFAFPSEED